MADLYTVNASLPQAGDLVGAVQRLRDAINHLRNVEGLIANMNDAQVEALLAFHNNADTPASAVILQGVVSNALTTLTTDANIDALLTQLGW